MSLISRTVDTVRTGSAGVIAKPSFCGRIMIYSHDTYGLGNIRRMLAIAQHMAKHHPQAKILVVTGSPMQHGFRVSPSIDFIKLPCLSRDTEGHYVPRSLGLTPESMLAVRADLISVAYRHFKPDLLLIDKKPLGVNGELNDLFRQIKAESAPPVVALVLRDILDTAQYTRRVWDKHGYHKIIESCYDLVLVAGQPEVFDVQKEYSFPATTMKKLRYCGYIDATGNSGKPHLHVVSGQAPARVLVTVGGGADGSNIAEHLIQSLMLRRPAASGEFIARVILGPEMDDSQRQRLMQLAKGLRGLELIEFAGDMASEINKAELVVSMCGYNTACEVLSAGKRMIAVPRVRPVREQLLRAQRLQDLGLLTMLCPDELSPRALLDAINNALQSPNWNSSGARLDFGGLDRIEYWLISAALQRQKAAYVPNCQRSAGMAAGVWQ